MGKLYEILAVEQDNKNVSERLILESIKTFKKENLFTGSIKVTELFDDEESRIPDEILKLETTVDENLQYSLSAVANYWDIVAQKDSTNMVAKADIVINGEIIAKDIPATTLLGMEKKLNNLRVLFNSIPTLPPGIGWEKDSEYEKDNVFRTTHTMNTLKTVKVIEFREVSPATKEHKAQIQQLQATKNIGKFITTKWSGMITPYLKAERITKLEKMISAVKKARQRANAVETVNIEIGDKIINFIMK